MIAAARIQRQVASALRRRGAPVTLRRIGLDRGPAPLPNPPTLGAGLVVDGDAAAGSTSVSLRAELARGRLLPGDTLVLNGASYPVLAACASRPPGSPPGFASVPISPALAADVPDGTPATLLFGADQVVPAVVQGFSLRVVDGELVRAGDVSVLVAALDLSPAPDVDDRVLVAGLERTVVAVIPTLVGTTPVEFLLQAR